MAANRSGSSPNLRVKEDANRKFHQVQAQVAGELGVGLRGVTADILVSGLLRVGVEHFPELVTAVEEERAIRAKGRR